MSKRYLPLFIAIAIAAATAGVFIARSLDQPAVVQLESGTALPAPGELSAFNLVDTRGGPVTPAELRGHPTLVFFGFTNCPDVCPTTLALLTQVQKKVALPGSDLAGLKVALISVDPERDTPEQMGKYLASFGGDLIGLTGTAPEIVKAQRSFGVAAARIELAGGGYTMDHSATVFALDARGRKVAVFTPPLRSDALGRDLAKLASTMGAGS